MYIEDIIQKLENVTGKKVKRSGHSYQGNCPAHDDQNPSLSISLAEDGKILFHCFAGCSLENICDAISIHPSDLFCKDSKVKNNRYEKIEYIYHDSSGVPLFKKIKGVNKKFHIEHFSDSGKWIRGLGETQRVLYNLPAIIEAKREEKTIFIVEGEKDADKLIEFGLIATTPYEGAGSNLRDEYTATLEGCNLVVLFDEDTAGYSRRDQWRERLTGVAASLKIVSLPGLTFSEKNGRDVSDWLKMGHTIDELKQLVESTPVVGSKNSKPKLNVLNFDEFLTRRIEQRAMIMHPIIPAQGLLLLYSKRGIGKTFLALSIGYSVAAGVSLLKWKVDKPRKVVYIDGEMPASLMQERLKKISSGLKKDLVDPSFFRIITPDLQYGDIPDLATVEGQNALEGILGDAELIILDNLSTLAPSLRENDADSWSPFQSWILKMRRKGISILLVHHAGKNGDQRGTSRREDALDVVLTLKRGVGYSAQEGASFEIEFLKARGFFGEDSESFAVKISPTDEDHLIWQIHESQENLYNEIVEEVSKRTPYRDIVEEYGVTKAHVEKIVKIARECGDLPA